jgi:DNA-binding MarR family transcriptional regulator
MESTLKKRKGYTIIPNILIRLKRENKISWIEYIVLTFIFANEDRPTSRLKIADELNGRRATVSDAIRSLQEKGFISIINIDDKFIKINTIF